MLHTCSSKFRTYRVFVLLWDFLENTYSNCKYSCCQLQWHLR